MNSFPFSKSYYRVVRENDLVPQVPPKFLGYRHTLLQYQLYGQNGQATACPVETGTGESPSCLDYLGNTQVHSDYYAIKIGC
jgi:hypothetical protein